jgi:hypothetical protein
MPEPRNPLEVVEEALGRAVDTPGLWCRGDESLGTACGKCSRCGLRAALTLLRKVRADAVVVRIVAEVASAGASDDVWEMRVIVPDGEHEDEGDEVALLMPFTDTETAK